MTTLRKAARAAAPDDFSPISRWQRQEREDVPRIAILPQDRTMPGGWWLLPAIAVSAILWAGLWVAIVSVL